LTTTIRKTYFAGRKQLPNKSFNEAAQHSRSVAEGSSTSIAVRTIVNGTQNTLNWLLSDHLGSASITTIADGRERLRYYFYIKPRSTPEVKRREHLEL